MCGIVGIIHKDGSAVSSEVLGRMNEALRHRGPDDGGVWHDGGVGLGHRRLSVIDLSAAGHQPMVADDWVIAYNGEVYNFAALRDALQQEGETFASKTDTEVVLRLCRRGVLEGLKALNGMFAFALLDRKGQSLYLVRDRFGIKPLYLYEDEKRFVFASELGAILQAGGVDTTLDDAALRDYLAYHYIPHPRTPYRRIRKLLPGEMLRIDLKTGHCESRRYFDLVSQTLDIGYDEAAERVEALLEEAVAMRLVSDVPVGLFLSGGVDSGLIAALAARHAKGRMESFSITLKGVSDFDDESGYAKEAAALFGMRHHAFLVGFSAFEEAFEAAVAAMDEPWGDGTAVLNHLLSAQTREHVTVALSGLGGDELFGGYNRHRAFLLQRMLRPVAFLRPAAALLAPFAGRGNALANRIRHVQALLEGLDSSAQKAWQSAVTYRRSVQTPPTVQTFALKEALYHDLYCYMSDGLLGFLDRMSMAHALEVRTPFLDYRLAELAFSLPENFLADLKTGKKILKTVAARHLPERLVYRRKQGFVAPVERWLRHMGEAALLKRLDLALLDRLTPPGSTRELVGRFFGRGGDYAPQLYAALVLSVWHAQRNRV